MQLQPSFTAVVHNGGMPLAYSYIRMSRPEQMRGDSLRRQNAAAEAWAARRGLRIDQTIRDIGVSAFRGKNRTVGALAEFLRLVEAGTVDRGSYLIVESLDRLSREAVLDTLPRFIDLIRAGVVVVTLADNQEYSEARLKADWTPLIVSLAVMSRAHEESRTKSLRVVEAWDVKRAGAKDKLVTARVPAWLEVVDGHVRELPRRSEVVRRIFRETVEGFGRRTIVRRLNEGNVPVFGGANGWQPSYVAKLLRNRAVLGEFQAWRTVDGVRRPEGEPVPGYFPVIVGEADFARASKSLERRAAAPGRRGTGIPNLFTGLARCACCNATMGVENKGKAPKGARYLVCGNARRWAGCDNRRRWRLDKIEDAILSRLWHLDPPNVLGRVETNGPDPVAGLSMTLETARKARSRLLDLVEAGDDEAVRRARDMTPKIKELERQLARAERDRMADTQTGGAVSELRMVLELRRSLARAEGEELERIRRRLAEAMRGALRVILFDHHTVKLVYKDARATRGARRVPVPGRPLPPLEVVAFDDTPGRRPSWMYDEDGKISVGDMGEGAREVFRARNALQPAIWATSPNAVK